MNNLNNPFEGAHPFRGKKERNSTPKKRNSTAGNINEQIVSIPLLFSPPSVVSTQINRRKSTFKQVHDNSVEKKREEDDFFQTDNDPSEQKKIVSLQQKEFSSIPEESSTSQDESSLIFEESSSLLEEISSKHEDTVKLPSKRKEPVSLQDEYSSMLEKPYFEKDESLLLHDKSSSKWDYQKKQSPIVKLPVLIAKVNVDIDIFDTIDLLFPLKNVIKIVWSLQSLDCSVILPSTTVFLKGVLIAEIEYANKGNKNTLHIAKLPISWSETTNINWLTLPKLPSSSHSEFMFQSPIDKEASSHFEFHQEFAEQIDSNLRKINFVWHQDFCSQLEIQKLHVVGIAQLSIDLLQSQYIELPLAGYI